MFTKPIHITLEKHVDWYVGLTKQGQHCLICVTRVSKGPSLVNDKTGAIELGELEREIETKTLSFNNVSLQGQPHLICVTLVSKGSALVNDKTDAVELGELEREIETETLSFNNVQSQRNDYWQDLEILPENDVRLQANDDNELDENVDDYRDGKDINTDDQNVESLAGNSKNTASSYYSRPKVIEDI
ncbi:hypothetical protein Fot_14491 [Forsythia ovata]|uniref:Uncharacterized protein n=1 Tax=Forsythia ovata TaxID=205694 RepID=A0ABD1W8U7_9LAMI